MSGIGGTVAPRAPLPGMQSLQISCNDIRNTLNVAGAYLSGKMVVQFIDYSNTPLSGTSFGLVATTNIQEIPRPGRAPEGIVDTIVDRTNFTALVQSTDFRAL